MCGAHRSYEYLLPNLQENLVYIDLHFRLDHANYISEFKIGMEWLLDALETGEFNELVSFFSKAFIFIIAYTINVDSRLLLSLCILTQLQIGGGCILPLITRQLFLLTRYRLFGNCISE